MVVDPAHDRAVERVGAPDLVAVDQVGPGALLPEQGQFAHVVLGVAVGVEDEVPRGGREAAAKGAAVAAIGLVGDARGRLSGRARASSSRIPPTWSGLASLTTMTSKSSVSSRATRWARATMEAIVPQSL